MNAADSPAGVSTGNMTLRMERWPIERLLPCARNARTHSDKQVAEIAGSIRAFGFANPILAGEDGDIVAGHGRLAAARQLGLREVPVVVLSGLSEAQRRQLMLADNRIALNAGWDLEMLRFELQDLKALGADLAVLGFTKGELARALTPASTGLTDEDATPPVAAKAVTHVGNTWCLGPHRVICGDCTEEAVVTRLLAGRKPQLMVTDPPYGVEYDAGWRNERGLSASNRTGGVLNDDKADWGDAWALFPGTLPTSGMPACMPALSLKASSGTASISGLK